MSNVSGVIYELNDTINTFESKVDVHVQNIHRSSTDIDRMTQNVYDKILEFRKSMENGEQKQLAHENIIRIDQIIKEQFSNHETIRRTVMGVVRDFDINLVRQHLHPGAVRGAVDHLFPLLAFLRADRHHRLGQQATPTWQRAPWASAAVRTPIKTTLFFCLLNLRFGRMETAKRWFQEYFKTLDPTMLQQETAVMLQAFLNGVFGRDKELEYSVASVIDQWISILNEDAAICEELGGSL